MIGRRAAVGLSLLCTLVLYTLAAQSASAAKAVNTTAVTCVEGKGELDFSDAHCDSKVTAGTGKYGHVAVPVNETKSIDGTNKGTGGITTPIVLKGKVFGAAAEITCSTMTTTTGASAVHNVETEKKHTMTGNGTAVFTNCSVQKPLKCDVQEPIEAAATFEGVEGLGPEKNTMGVEYVGENKGTFATITFQNNGAESCSLAGKSGSIEGSVIGTSNVSPSGKWTGATITFSAANEMEKLLFGGSNAEVNLTATPTGTGGGAHPIPITTTT